MGLHGMFYKLLEVQCGKDPHFPGRKNKNQKEVFSLIVNTHDFLGKECGLDSEAVKIYSWGYLESVNTKWLFETLVLVHI